jgi:hypothetical protein
MRRSLFSRTFSSVIRHASWLVLDWMLEAMPVALEAAIKPLPAEMQLLSQLQVRLDRV